MNPYMAVEAVNTKIVTKQGYLLNKDNWKKLFSFNSVSQLTEFFRNDPEFKIVFKDLSTEEIHRNNLEALLNKYRTYEIEELLHYFSGHYKSFVQALLKEAEIQDLSLILRKIARYEKLNGIKENFVHSEKYTDLNFDKLLNSRNLVSFTENLKGSLYYNDLRNLTKEDAIKREFHIEMKLHLNFYNNLLKKAEDLSKEDMNTAKEIIGYKIDLENVQWIYRALNYYKISPEEILIYSINGGKKINYNHLKKLCYIKSNEDFIKTVNSYLKFDFFEEMKSKNSNLTIDQHMLKFIKKNKFRGIGTILTYYFLVGIIIYDLTSVTEGIKYNAPKERILEYLSFKI